METKTMRNFHVPLPSDLYEKLREEADRSNRPATHLVRHAIEVWLERERRQALHEAITEYATRNAGADVDLDEDLESAAVDHLLAQDSGGWE